MMEYDYVSLSYIARNTNLANANVVFWMRKLGIETKTVLFGGKTMRLIPFDKKDKIVNAINNRVKHKE